MTTSPISSDQKVGLFQVTYRIGTNEPGARELTLDLEVATPEKHITGRGRLFQATNPPLDRQYEVQGTYRLLMIAGGKIQADLKGVTLLPGSDEADSTANPQPQLYVEMSLSADWSGGIATYRYLNAQGQWDTVSNVPVAKAPSGVSN